MTRLYLLSKELGIDRKLLVDYCRLAGVPASSGLAELSDEERERVIEYIRERQKSDLCAAAHARLLVGTCPWRRRKIWKGRVDSPYPP
jgi:hypothetical protein